MPSIYVSYPVKALQISQSDDETPASKIVASPCPVVPILTEDFLGVMSGQLQYIPELRCSDKAIKRPDLKIWLDFSKITGKLSCVRSADFGTEANVTLTWKRYNNQHGYEFGELKSWPLKRSGPLKNLSGPILTLSGASFDGPPILEPGLFQLGRAVARTFPYVRLGI